MTIVRISADLLKRGSYFSFGLNVSQNLQDMTTHSQLFHVSSCTFFLQTKIYKTNKNRSKN